MIVGKFCLKLFLKLFLEKESPAGEELMVDEDKETGFVSLGKISAELITKTLARCQWKKEFEEEGIN